MMGGQFSPDADSFRRRVCQLAELSNRIGRAHDVDEITRTDGDAALLWLRGSRELNQTPPSESALPETMCGSKVPTEPVPQDDIGPSSDNRLLSPIRSR